ncbi:MlaD family protein [Flavisolibacter ginsengisoli]|jgi:phospholipid/cholesterol/gamma-HCH transport system substrate-binding protein|uniref:Phospholipid/cholesterol/gamma-HCH transport system substrate-binding protein n=1 Tax=Flavisolibacter ginsengisoli DSM 18119 TaxID=1121884 RepID=A0A1M5AQ41_9BACT|nr:MlaD family protein [Flavisolibacter ginsengisoli]SHF32042.1 phospholipid/cholesterol/gamma-HCH transport system substrate-binding protein [Flavisolibacter ginsengisoli DSM 18119]
MKTTMSQKTRIGLFTVIGVLILVAGIFIIGKKKNLFGDTFHIYGTFNNVGGLQVGNNIRFAGINVGTVEDISIISDTMIRVDMVLQSKIKPFLKSTSFASIGSDGLMGDKLITITAGAANTVVLANGSRILTINPMDFDKSIAKLTKVASNAEIISGELAAITIQIREGKGSMGRLLYHDDLAKGLEGTMQNAQNLTGSLADITGEIKAGKGSLGRLLYNDTLAKSLEGTAAHASTTMATINDAAFGFSENMKALQGNFLFKGYFKRQAKAKEKAAAIAAVNIDSTDIEMNDADLAEIEAAAQKAQQAIIDRKKKEKEKQ